MKTWRFSSAGIAVTAITLAVFVRVHAEPAVADVLTYHYDNARLGATLTETVLNTATVSSGRFGKLWTLYADGQVVAQPLYVSGLRIDTTATEHAARAGHIQRRHRRDDAQHGVRLRRRQGEPRGPTAARCRSGRHGSGQPRPGGKDIDMWSTNDPEWGILSTPVISADKTTLYRRGLARRRPAGAALPAARAQPAERHASPAAGRRSACRRPIRRSRAEPRVRSIRARTSSAPALLLADGVLYVAFGGDGNRGALFAFDAQTLAQTRVLELDADRQRRRHLAVGPGARGRRGGQRLPDDRQRHLRRRPRRPELRQQLRQAEARRARTSSSRTTSRPATSTFLNQLDLDLGSGGPVLLPGTPRADRQRRQSRACSTWSIRDEHGQALRASDRPGLPEPQRRAAGQRVRRDRRNGNQTHYGNIHGSPVFWQGPDTGAHLRLGREQPR